MKKIKQFVFLFLFIGFSYQALELLVEYLEYPTMQKIDVLPNEKPTWPSLTFCDRSYDQIEAMPANFLLSDPIDPFTRIPVELVYYRRNDLYCATAYNKIFKKPHSTLPVWANNSSKVSMKISASGYSSLVSVHPPIMPPPMAELINTGCLFSMLYDVRRLLLMPPPYDTDCKDPEKNASVKSVWDCQFRCLVKDKSLNSKEYIFYKNITELKNQRDEQIYKIKKGCMQKCKKQCNYEMYSQKIMEQLNNDECGMTMGFMGMMKPRFKKSNQLNELVIEYQEEINFILLLVETGSLLSLWFDVCIFDIVNYLKQIKKFKLVSLFRKIRKILTLLMTLCCCYQVFDVVKEYLKYPTTTNTIIDKTCSIKGTCLLPGLIMYGLLPDVESDQFNDDIKCRFINDKNQSFVPQRLNVKKRLESTIKYEFNRTDVKQVICDLYIPEASYSFLPFRGYQVTAIITDINKGGEEINPLIIVDRPLSYIWKVNQETVVRLPAPYDTACVDYESDDIGHSNLGSQGQGGCVFKCRDEVLEERFNCTISISDVTYVFDKNNQTWKPEKAKNLPFCMSALFGMTRIVEECRHVCKSPCLQVGMYRKTLHFSRRYSSCKDKRQFCKCQNQF